MQITVVVNKWFKINFVHPMTVKIFKICRKLFCKTQLYPWIIFITMFLKTTYNITKASIPYSLFRVKQEHLVYIYDGISVKLTKNLHVILFF